MPPQCGQEGGKDVEDKKITVCPFCGRTAISGTFDLNKLFRKLWVYCMSINIWTMLATIIPYVLGDEKRASITVAANTAMLAASYFWFLLLQKHND